MTDIKPASPELAEFLKKTIKRLKASRDFVRFIPFEENGTFSFGDLLDCFECTINQRYRCELICTTAYVFNGSSVFEDAPENEPCYVLTIQDFGGDMYGGVLPDIEPEQAMLCFTTYAASKMVLRNLVEMYSADGV